MAGLFTVFDIDGTIFKTKAQTMVIKNGIVVKKLNETQMQSYILEDDESFDFSEFSSAKYFYDTAVPIYHVIKKAKELIKQSRSNSQDKIALITGRPNLDDDAKFAATFKKYGMDIDNMYVERVGNNGIYMGQALAKRKAAVIRKYITITQYDMVQMFEDSKQNLKEFIRLAYSFPHISFSAYFVNPSGNIVPFK